VLIEFEKQLASSFASLLVPPMPVDDDLVEGRLEEQRHREDNVQGGA